MNDTFNHLGIPYFKARTPHLLIPIYSLSLQILYSRFSYKWPMPKSALFVFYEND